MHSPVPFWRVDGISTVLSVRIEVLFTKGAVKILPIYHTGIITSAVPRRGGHAIPERISRKRCLTVPGEDRLQNDFPRDLMTLIVILNATRVLPRSAVRICIQQG